jgi:uncharacterized membrane protein YidH (DUF202 family)
MKEIITAGIGIELEIGIILALFGVILGAVGCIIFNTQAKKMEDKLYGRINAVMWLIAIGAFLLGASIRSIIFSIT